MIRALTVGLAVVVTSSMLSPVSLSAEPEAKRKMNMILMNSSEKLKSRQSQKGREVRAGDTLIHRGSDPAPVGVI